MNKMGKYRGKFVFYSQKSLILAILLIIGISAFHSVKSAFSNIAFVQNISDSERHPTETPENSELEREQKVISEWSETVNTHFSQTFADIDDYTANYNDFPTNRLQNVNSEWPNNNSPINTNINTSDTSSNNSTSGSSLGGNSSSSGGSPSNSPLSYDSAGGTSQGYDTSSSTSTSNNSSSGMSAGGGSSSSGSGTSGINSSGGSGGGSSSGGGSGGGSSGGGTSGINSAGSANTSADSESTSTSSSNTSGINSESDTSPSNTSGTNSESSTSPSSTSDINSESNTSPSSTSGTSSESSTSSSSTSDINSENISTSTSSTSGINSESNTSPSNTSGTNSESSTSSSSTSGINSENTSASPSDSEGENLEDTSLVDISTEEISEEDISTENASLQDDQTDVPANDTNMLVAKEYISKFTLSNKIEQFGITWYFDANYPTGQFANGDYWVVGPVTIVTIDPEPSDGRNGSMINPNSYYQGYDDRVAYYDSSLSVSFPATIGPGSSLISVESYSVPDCSGGKKDLMNICVQAAQSKIDKAAVLTIVKTYPSSSSFRPPFMGTDKPLFDSKNINQNVLPKLAPVAHTPDPEVYARYFERPWINQVRDWQGRISHARANQPNYYREAYRIYGEATLLLMLDIPNTETLLINFIQQGIDAAYLTKLKLGDRHTSKWPIIFAGILLSEPDLFSHSYGAYREITQTYYGNDGNPYWRQKPGLEYEQVPKDDWKDFGKYPQFYNAGGSQGAYKLENYRNCCSSSTWPGIALSASLIGARQAYDHDAFFDYVERWMSESSYNRSSSFVVEMWDTYHVSIGME